MMKVLFAGLGGIGQRHLKNLLLLKPDVEIYAIRKRRESFVLDSALQILEGERLEETYPIHVVGTLEEAARAGIDTIFICNPTSMHMEYLTKALSFGWDILVEKPLAHSLEESDQMERLLARSKNVTMVAYQNRFHPCVKTAREILNRGELGRICCVNAVIGENIKNWHKYEDYRRMYASRRDLGGGVVLSQIHELDYLYWFLGMPDHVYAAGGHFSSLEIDVEDVAEITLTYRKEDHKFTVHIHEDYLMNPPARSCRIVGDNGYLEFNLLTSEIVQYNGEGEQVYRQVFEFQRNDMFLEELNHFLECRKRRIATSIPIEEGMASLKIAVAVKQSMDMGLPVNLRGE